MARPKRTRVPAESPDAVRDRDGARLEAGAHRSWAGLSFVEVLGPDGPCGRRRKRAEGA